MQVILQVIQVSHLMLLRSKTNPCSSSPVPTVTRGRLANEPHEPPHKYQQLHVDGLQINPSHHQSLVTRRQLAPTPAPTYCKIRQIRTKCGSQTAVRPAPDTCGQHSGSQLPASREVPKFWKSCGPLFCRLFFKLFLGLFIGLFL